jgi:methyl-accepting chemotaxis protein
MWSFGRKIALGFALSFALLLGVGGVSYRSTNLFMSTSEAVEHSHTVLDRIATMLSQLKDAETGQRGFVITGDEAYLAPYQDAVRELPRTAKELRELTRDNPAQQARLDEVDGFVASKLTELAQTIQLRRTRGFEETKVVVTSGAGKSTMDSIRVALGEVGREERALLAQRASDAAASASSTRATIFAGTLVCLLIIVAAGVVLTRSLTTQIGSAVRNVQSSSVELQAAANQQMTGAKEQATAMNEITSTISELLATSRQISESARRVSQIAAETTTAAHSGDQTVQRAHDSISAIKRQVDVIVGHMLELGKKSQQVGVILEIINELAEQTNILAINATIEAAGAGEAGKRFAVVADEIRRLADRVGGSTKEINTLVNEIRSAVNTTVMATEGGAKSVDAGTQEFDHVASSFKQIVSLVGTTTDAAKEIELSTKQQTSAVEQVNLAVGDVAQASKESATSSSQTLQTSSQLSELARVLARVLDPNA